MCTAPVPKPRSCVGMSSTVYWMPVFIEIVMKKRLAIARTVIVTA